MDVERFSSDALSVEETGQRAAGGAALLVGRSMLVLIVGLGANIALARLLTPRDFGLVALGTVFVTFGSFFADAGLGAGLIRRAEPPTRRELEAVNGVQLALTSGLAAIVALAAIPFGRDGLVVATMAAALPVLMVKVPSVIVLERRLDFRVIATVDVVEAVVFYAWAVTTVALGAGVWGFATAVLARAIAGMITMVWRGPLGIVRPRWAMDAIRPMLGFALKFQASVMINLTRDQLVNAGVAIVGGVATLGVWSLAWRVLQIPIMVFGTVGRIAFPAMARVLEAGHDPRPTIERGGGALAIMAGAILVALLGFAPALPAAVGAAWDDVPVVLLIAGGTMIATVPVIYSSSPYLFAVDAGGTVVKASIALAVIWLAVTLSLAGSIGAPAVPLGWLAGALVQLPVLAMRTTRLSGAALLPSVGVPAAVALVAGVAGWVAADEAGGSLGAGALGVVAGEAVLAIGLLALRRPALRDTGGLLRRALGDLGRRHTGAATSSGPVS